jgi:hypothetical protein
MDHTKPPTIPITKPIPLYKTVNKTRREIGIASVDIVQSGDLMIGNRPFNQARTNIALN